MANVDHGEALLLARAAQFKMFGPRHADEVKLSTAYIEAVTLLRHAAQRSHPHSPRACSPCGAIEAILNPPAPPTPRSK